MELEVLEQYSNTKLDLYKANEEIKRLRNELDIHKRETAIVMEESIMLDDLKSMFNTYGSGSVYIKDEYVYGMHSWVNNKSDFPLIKE